MTFTVVVGVNWGDEGKGRIVDYLAQQADFVIRFQGGANAGHTIVNEFGTSKLHLVPSGIFSPGVVNLLGPGTVVNLEAAVEEMESLRTRGISIGPDNYKISNRATICFPFHRLQDEYEEVRLGAKSFGSTRQGIAPVYGDRYMKYGVQVGALLYPEYLQQEIVRCLSFKNKLFTKVYNQPVVEPEKVYNWAMHYGNILAPYICDSVDLLKNAYQSGKRILLEGQLGALRDVYYGIYPYPTSSSTLGSFGIVGSGCFSREMPNITGVMKAFSTCIGEGPFVTEIKDSLADQIRETSFEYGAATGRPRRIGWFDAVASRYGAYISGAHEIALTKLDSLTGINALKICPEYMVNNKQVTEFPVMPELAMAAPVFVEIPGWEEDISGIRNFDNLPENTRNYVLRLESLVGLPVKYISVGPSRDAMIIR
jgi:adenylosuccinate synthase